MKFGKVYISCGFLLAIAVIVFLAGPEAMGLLIAASAAHELGHLAVLKLLGAGPGRIVLTATGCAIYSNMSGIGYAGEIAAALAGPAAGLLLAFAVSFWKLLYPLAGVSFALSIFNLLPCSRLDGGRVLYCAAAMLWNERVAEKVLFIMTCAIAAALAAIALLSTAPAAAISLLAASIWALAGLTRRV